MTLPPGWESQVDASTGRTYYVNMLTNQIQWEEPVDAAAASAPPLHQPHAAEEAYGYQPPATKGEYPVSAPQAGFQPPATKGGEYEGRDLAQATAVPVVETVETSHPQQISQYPQGGVVQGGVVAQQPGTGETIYRYEGGGVPQQAGPSTTLSSAQMGYLPHHGSLTGGVQPVPPPPGVATGGEWRMVKHCGLITWLVGIFIFPCVCCCPCDDRRVYILNNTHYDPSGAVLPGGCC